MGVCPPNLQILGILFRKARLSREDDVYIVMAPDMVVVTRVRAEHLEFI